MASVGNSKDSISLNIMPMLDIFSILILFLLMNFSTDPMSHDLNEGVELPDSISTVSLDEIPTLIMSKKDIIVNEKKVASISAGDIEKNIKAQGGIFPLFEELKKLSEAQARLAKRPSATGKTDSLQSLTLEVDKTHSFSLIKRVLLTSQQANFIKFKFMVSKEIN